MYTSKTPITLDELGRLAPSALASAPHASRSSRYGFQSTLAVIQALAKEGFSIFSASESRSNQTERSGFLKHALRFRRVEDFQKLAIVGEVTPEVVLVNSMDGTSLLEVMGGIFRFVCGNGMVVADSLVQTVRIRHTANMIQEALAATIAVANQTQKALSVVNEWKKIPLANSEQLVLASEVHKLRFETPTPITPAQLLDMRRAEDSGNDLWSVTNRIQENTIKGGLTARAKAEDGSLGAGRRVRSREVKNIGADIKLNQAIWSLSTKMAELKQS